LKPLLGPKVVAIKADLSDLDSFPVCLPEVFRTKYEANYAGRASLRKLQKLAMERLMFLLSTFVMTLRKLSALLTRSSNAGIMSGAGASFEEGISKSTPQEWDDEVLFFSCSISLSFHNQTLISELTEKIV
jgi:hypothetical protein